MLNNRYIGIEIIKLYGWNIIIMLCKRKDRTIGGIVECRCSYHGNTKGNRCNITIMNGKLLCVEGKVLL